MQETTTSTTLRWGLVDSNGGLLAGPRVGAQQRQVLTIVKDGPRFRRLNRAQRNLRNAVRDECQRRGRQKNWARKQEPPWIS